MDRLWIPNSRLSELLMLALYRAGHLVDALTVFANTREARGRPACFGVQVATLAAGDVGAF